MKMRTSAFLVGLLLATQPGFTQVNVWTGSVSSEWTAAGNWSLGQVPNAGSIVSISPASNSPALSTDVTVKKVSLTYSGSLKAVLSLNGHALTADTTLMQGSQLMASGGTVRTKFVTDFSSNEVLGDFTFEVNDPVFRSNCGAMNGNNTFFGKFHLKAGAPQNACYFSMAKWAVDTYKKPATFEVTGGIFLLFGQYSSGPMLFEDSVSFVSYGSHYNYFRLFGGANVVFKGPVRFDITGGMDGFLSSGRFEKAVTFSTHTNYYAGLLVRKDVIFEKEVYVESSGGILSFESPTFSPTSKFLIGPSGFSEGELYLNAVTFGCTSPIDLSMGWSGSSSSDRPTAIHIKPGTVFKQPVKIAAPFITANGAKFEQETTLERIAIDSNLPWYPTVGARYSPGGNTFDKSVRFVNRSGSDWYHGYAAADTYRDSVFVAYGGNRQGNSPYGSQINSLGGGAMHFSAGGGTTTEFSHPLILETEPGAKGGITLGWLGGKSKIGAQSKMVAAIPVGWLDLKNMEQFSAAGDSLSIQLSSTANLRIENSKFDGLVSVATGHLYLSGSEFGRPSAFTKSASGVDTSIGGNTFHQRVQFKNTASTGKISLISGEDRLIE